MQHVAQQKRGKMKKKLDQKNKKQQKLDQLYDQFRDFKKTPLYIPGSRCIVFGEGNPDARLLFIGEAPGKNEDLQGRPFVGRSGKLLNRALELAGASRDEVYITNIVKCRPPNNRTPFPHELRVGKKLLLEEQVKIIHPTVICTLGSPALLGLTEHPYQITKVRGQQLDHEGIILIPTFHPAYVLRNHTVANDFLEDIKKAVRISQKYD
jgi:uracil-DNA glycosylase